MHAVVSNRSLEPRGKINHFLRGWVSFVFVFQIRHVFNCVSELHMMPHHWIRYHFGNPIGLGIWYFEHTRHIAHGVFRHHLTKGCDI